ncbi:MAG: glucose 1-dehydrogenase [Dehalococcoidia bacterium]|nr:glucose 1-dehydrogenase [Dehalococcoidia bacterium]
MPDVDNLFDLSGKTALVTGGSRGLGREITLAFAHAGADVVIASRKLDSCEQLAKEVRDKTGKKALPIACNVGDWDQVDQLADAAYDHFGKVDILVNNAGMSPLYDNLASVSESLYDKVLGVNLKGPFRLTALIGSRMVEGDGGSVIMVSSMASVRPGKNALPYAAAKAGLNAITIGFAQAYGPKVRVNGIVAGPFLTDIAKAWDMENFEKRAEESIPLGRAGDPHEIVGAALYFASAASSYTTGALLQVAGGS